MLADPADKGKDETPIVRVAFVGDVDNWEHMAWFNYTLAATWIKQECAVIGLKCQVAMVQRGDFCNVKVRGGGEGEREGGGGRRRGVQEVCVCVLECVRASV